MKDVEMLPEEGIPSDHFSLVADFVFM